MNKKRILLGVLILMAMAVCSIWFCNIPSVFAAETPAYETVENEAGTFTGQGYYVVGQTAVLTAVMNPGYQFDGWISVDDEGNKLADLSTDLEYTFVVEERINIEATWSRIKYTVDFDNQLKAEGVLKDFDYTIVNNNDEDGSYYYGDELVITLIPKSYIDNLTNKNTTINGKTIHNLISSGNAMAISTQLNTDANDLMTQFVITLNIKEDIIFNIDYHHLYQLSILSGNGVPVDEVIEFVSVTNYHTKLDNYTYLARDDKEITVTVSAGDDVYTLSAYQMEGMDPNNKYSQSYILDSNKEFKVYYNKKGYDITFNSFITNRYGEYDLLESPIYNISSVQLATGDTVGLNYNEITRKITITNAQAVEIEYEYPADIYGYKFVGFAINNEIIEDDYYTLSQPQNVEIQLIFEYIKYQFEIQLVDEYFADGVEFGFNYSNGVTELVKGTEINVYANTYKYLINGWTWVQNPTADDYIAGITDPALYSFIFNPDSDEQSMYTLYLDVDYKYTSITYSLKSNSIEQNVNYDIVKVDLTNKKITFNNSENAEDVQVVDYLDEDVTVDAVRGTVINTASFGELEILGDVLTCTYNHLPVQSISKTTNEGVDEYRFNKYTYFGELKVAVIEHIELAEVGEDVTVTVYGTSYDENGSISGEIQSLTTTKTYNDAVGAYKIDNFPYNMYLYMNAENNTEYAYIELRGVKYYYNGTSFVLNNALINVPEAIEYEVVKNSQYVITLSNLLPNMLLTYSTKSTDSINYNFTNFTSNGSIPNYTYNDYIRCILDIEVITQLNVEYRKLENNITLNITNENAYSYSDIQFTVNGNPGTGRVINATDGESIVIVISTAKIAKGYKFDGFALNGTDITDIHNPTMLELTMQDAYVNQVINISFSEIEYTININYIDKDNNAIEQANANGVITLLGQPGAVTELSVVLNGRYTIKAIANEGYYAQKAYIGAEAYDLTNLVGNNQLEQTITTWELNSDNFIQAIFDNADAENKVNLYIHFAIHTYNVKIYFEIDEHKSLITYPDTYINGTKAQLNESVEMDGEVLTTRYYVEAEGIEYGSSVRIIINNFRLGTSFMAWEYMGEKLPESTSNYQINSLTRNIVLTMHMQYVKYGVQFAVVDDNDNPCNYGSVSNSTTVITWYHNIEYTVNAEQGYIWKETYYINQEGTKTSKAKETRFIFDPANFSIENSSIVVYVKVGVKQINVNVVNEQNGTLPLAGPWAIYTISREREGQVESLTGSNYEFYTGDQLIMDIVPQSIGIEMSMAKLGQSEIITTATTYPYNLTTVDIFEDDKIVGMYYKVTILFTPSLVGSLTNNVDLINVLNVKTYKLTYTYEYIDYKFGVDLTIQYNGTSFRAQPDVEILRENIPFSTQITFGVSYMGMNNEITNNFRVVGYILAGIPVSANSSFKLQDISLWESIALAKYIDGDSQFKVILKINPKITLSNYTHYSKVDGYRYERGYIGQNQGITTEGNNADVVVGANFSVAVKYSYDGINYSNIQPIDCGEYPVKITAEITATGKEPIHVDFDEKVILKITPAPLSLVPQADDNGNMEFVKTYDATSNYSAELLIRRLKINGLYERDNGKIFIDANRLKVRFSGISVNSPLSLYDIIMQDIYLIDNTANDAPNYKLSSGTNLMLHGLGLVTPKELTISGFKPKNKVYDGTNEVVVDISEIIYEGIIGTDSTQIDEENLKFYLDNFSVGVAREVKLNSEGALSGADSINYRIVYKDTYIDVHPYEISYEVEGYGVFKVVDEDRLCLIPIGAEMFAAVYEKGSEEYRNFYQKVESNILQGEKLKICYEVTLRQGAVNQLVPQGLYIYLPKIKKVSKVIQIVDSNNIGNLNHDSESKYTVIRAQEGDPVFTIIVRSTYLPLWLIILIICLSIVLVSVLVFIFILIRRKTKNKYSSYDRI